MAAPLLIRRGSEPLRGEWSIPGGTLELGESLQEGVARELSEETGLDVRVLELIEVFDRIFFGRKREDFRAGAPSPLSFRHCRLFVRAHRRGSSRWERCDRRGFCQRRRAYAVPPDRNGDSRAKKSLCHGSCARSGALIHGPIYLRPGAGAAPIRSLSRSLCDFNASVRIGELQLATSRSDRPV